ncbi:MAG: ketohexokinase [Gammaproteobacteria bacterium]|nr:ketohexokinase [Gammaproteobacteria bacterium]
MARILGVGIATLDIVNEVDHYPAEDEEMRATAQHVRRGGNCTNTLTVLSQLGHGCDWSGVLAAEPDGGRIVTELEQFSIGHQHSLLQADGKVPTSYITLNRANGSRTIVHYRNLPELPYEVFESIDLTDYDWIHFEGRNIGETKRMMQRCREHYPDIPLSLEAEKPRESIDELFSHADVILYSRAYAQALGYKRAEEFLLGMNEKVPTATLYCAWGAQGGYGLVDDSLFHQAAFAPEVLVDTLGAGDSFNAGIIHAQLQQQSPQEVLHYACRLAGYKCGRSGLDIQAFE